MVRKQIAVAVALASLAVSACGGRMINGNAPSSSTIVMLPPLGRDLLVYATVPALAKDTVGEELPSEGLGVVHSVKWQAYLGGYTQQRYSQSLGFSPKTKITIVNLSRSITHTLDVVAEIKGPPAHFPKNPKLPIQAHGGKNLQLGYASGPIKPGKSVTVTLVKAGIYLIGCAFHYGSGMHDVLVVKPGAAPGPQATPTTRPSTSPTVRSSYMP
jgi:plastocyanin